MFEKQLWQHAASSLNEFADFISEALKGPVTIEDATHRLLAYSGHPQVTDGARTATIMGRRVPEEVIHRLWNEGVIPSLHQQNEPISISAIDEIGLGTRMAVAVKEKQTVIGYIWVVEGDTPFSEEAKEDLHSAAVVCGQRFRQQLHPRNPAQQDQQEYFWRLLTGDETDEQAVEHQILRFFPGRAQQFSIVVIEFSERLEHNAWEQLNYLLTISQQVKVMLKTYDQHQAILMLYGLESRNIEATISAFLRQMHRVWQERYGDTLMAIAASEICHRYTEVAGGYSQALTMLDLKKQVRQLPSHYYFLHEAGYYRFFPVLLQRWDEETFTHPSLKNLFDYDAENETELLSTLYIYLSEDCNVNAAAKILHVHPNTLSYRLKRMQAIAGIRLNTAHEKWTLLLELELLKEKQTSQL
ncbi:hypothetical protein CHL76_14805 [Marinococcus halophilus]|uniref:Transcriptional activator AdeR n=1 Tax=Marinococcus halophilus TaxID=1371 RepID=A0A510Y9E4_MARHA|nr:helix-turn-helix domain-containing protein [Marinococcus halophilus]OZT79014.1 hypothetical protein CHL76_14805 [Marinococcus halophilus]GEK60002.1 transcriptional activator AdeR [Marinococcus halophilus]